jgi:hypothetical protein
VPPPAELVPAGHAEQCPAPGATLYVPASHAVHAAPSKDPEYPAEHLQSINARLPPAEFVPAGHAEHCPTPVSLLYVSASHAVHAAPSDVALYPATHLQSSNSSLPDAQLVPAGHAEHCPTPVAALYAPASHASHATPSEAAVYPATHLQSINALLPSNERVFDGHAAQLPGPPATLYVPA